MALVSEIRKDDIKIKNKNYPFLFRLERKKKNMSSDGKIMVHVKNRVGFFCSVTDATMGWYVPGKGLTQLAVPYHHISVPTWKKLIADDMNSQTCQ